MPYLGGFFGVLVLALWIFALADVISSAESECRHLPKMWWLLIVLLFVPAGPIAWLVLGRPPRAGVRRGVRYERSAPAFPEYDRPGRAAATDSDSDEEFLRKCRKRAEEQRRKAREDRQD